jgi:hypothetical protein
MVAWHEMPGKRVRMEPSRRVRYDRSAMRPLVLRCKQTMLSGSSRYPTGRVHCVASSGHFVPGYHRKVPPGQTPERFQERV